MQPKPLTSWYGGKARMAPIIAAKLPPHKIYVEPFGGMAGVLMAKKPSEAEVYNDLHNGVVALFRVVRDPAKCQELLIRLEFTPYARAEWRECVASWEGETDEIEKARKVYVTLSQNFVGRTAGGSWSFGGPQGNEGVAHTFRNGFENIRAVCERLGNVIVENAPAMNVLRQWDNPNTCFYLDPPYLHETRHGGKEYKHELSTQEHIELLAWCLKAKGKIIISGYPSALYTEMLEGAGWAREDYSAIATSAMQTFANGLRGKPGDLAKRTECLWFSPNAKPLTLWDYKEA